MWTIHDGFVIVVSVISIFYKLFNYRSRDKQLEPLLQIDSDFPSFDNLFQLDINSDFYLGLTLALNWLEIFKYLSVNRTLLLLSQTMSLCLTELLAFACIFFIIFLAYTQLGWLLFGGYLPGWRSFRTSM